MAIAVPPLRHSGATSRACARFHVSSSKRGEYRLQLWHSPRRERCAMKQLIGRTRSSAILSIWSALLFAGCDDDEGSGGQAASADKPDAAHSAGDPGDKPATTSAPRAKTSYGEVEGLVEDGIRVFKG